MVQMKSFVLIQPGCDMNAADIATFDSDDTGLINYILDRGGDAEFFERAEVGDAMSFDRERVVLRVGKVW